MSKSKPIIERLKKEGIDKIKIGVFDVDGVLRGKYINLNKFESALNGGFGFCDVVFGWDVADELYDKPSVTGWHSGYPDALAVVDESSERRIPREPNTVLFLADFINQDGTPYSACPRQLLKQQLAKAESLGFMVKSSLEYEFFLFDETPHSVREKNYENLKPFTPGMFGYSVLRNSVNCDLFHDIIDTCKEMNFELEGLHTETGPGVLEASVNVDSGLSAADKAALFKTFMKVIAQHWELMATFMAKWSPDYPGQSGHLHQSLWNLDGTSAFYDENEKHSMSVIMQHYLAGQLTLLPEVLPMIAPTINSYTRMIPGFWAPTHSNWGWENRTCAIRVISGKPKSQRVEYRIAAADGNPHLVMAAAIACGLYGIENKIPLQPMVNGNAYDVETSEENPELPNTLEKSIESFKNSPVMKEIFGNAWVNHYSITREWECKEYETNKQSETDWHWMLDRYFEII